MKALILTTALIIGTIGSGFSQTKQDRQKKSPEERAKQMTEKLDAKLNLTEKQESEIYQFNLDHSKKMEKMRSSNQDLKKSRMEDHKEMKADNEKKMEKILNTDQMKTYRQLQDNAKSKMKKHHQKKDERPKN